MWQIGDVTVTRVEETISPFIPEDLMPDYAPDLLEANTDWLRPHFFSGSGKLLLSIHSFVIESEGTTIVVDTCIADEASEPAVGDPTFLERLAAATGGELANVDVVLCTHLHFDHVGWNTIVVDGQRVPTFPTARYLFNAAELEYTQADNESQVMEPSVQPLLDAGLVDLVTTDHRITSEVSLVPTPGHTPGHVSVAIASGGDEAFITGDMVHTPLQFAYADLPSASFDWDSELSNATRHAIIDRYANRDTTILGTHFAPPTAGRIRRDAARVWFET